MAYNTYNYQPYTSGYNTVNPYQQNQQYPPAQNMQQAQNGGYICRPVTCREEAVAAQVDYFAAGLVMPDLNHGMIYVKRFNPNTGASDFGEFKYCPPQPQISPEAANFDPEQFVTRQEFEEFTRRMQAVKEAEYEPV